MPAKDAKKNNLLPADFNAVTRFLSPIALYLLTSLDMAIGKAPIVSAWIGRQRLYAIENYPLPVAPIYAVSGIL